MSEYQYYEFQAIDRPLNETDRQALRRDVDAGAHYRHELCQRISLGRR